MKITVNNCHDCPFCNNDNEYGTSCNFPNNDVDENEMPSYKQNWLPSKCPLKFSGTVLIGLKQEQDLKVIPNAYATPLP